MSFFPEVMKLSGITDTKVKSASAATRWTVWSCKNNYFLELLLISVKLTKVRKTPRQLASLELMENHQSVYWSKEHLGPGVQVVLNSFFITSVNKEETTTLSTSKKYSNFIFIFWCKTFGIFIENSLSFVLAFLPKVMSVSESQPS